jgi:vacuolar-type H+-ATPase subunit H
MPIIITNDLKPTLTALSDEALNRATELTTAALDVVVAPEAKALEAANAIYRALDKHSKDIAAARLELTRPIDALKEKIIAAERQATKPMDEARVSLGKKISAADTEMRRLHEEAMRKAREEADRKAAEERRRQEEERRKIIEQQEAERKAAQEAADAEAALFGTKAEVVSAPEPPPPVVVVPIVETPAELAAAVLPKAAVRTTVRKVLFIEDASKIPREMAGVLLLEPNDKAIKKLLEAGVSVPGCRLVDEQRIGSAGSRGQ